MKTTNTPAFPVHGLPGMTLRDYFAAKAMQALLSHQRTLTEFEETVARAAYEQADAMLEAREQ